VNTEHGFAGNLKACWPGIWRIFRAGIIAGERCTGAGFHPSGIKTLADELAGQNTEDAA
jgi:hypothetical protein